MGILTWIVLGLLAGILARIVSPWKAPHGLIVTLLLGIGGAMLGGFLATQLGWGDISGFNLRSIGIAFGGAVIILILYHLILYYLIFGKR